eukprot:4695970-Pyramimonas_sp.AAC.2
MVLSLQELLMMHAPTVAGKKHHELQVRYGRVLSPPAAAHSYLLAGLCLRRCSQRTRRMRSACCWSAWAESVGCSQAFANRVWRIHFEKRPALKNKTLGIYEALHDLTEQSLAQIEELSREVSACEAAALSAPIRRCEAPCNEFKSQIKRAKTTEELAVRKMKRMEAYHQQVMDEKKEVLSKPRQPDPSVLHHGLPVSTACDPLARSTAVLGKR